MTPLKRIGTRGSRLALWQANWVQNALKNIGVRSEIVVVHTAGDRSRNGPVANIGAPGVFTKEIERALLSGQIDLAVHSLKDLPTEPAEGLVLAAVPERADLRDVFVSRRFRSLEEIPDGARIGTGSLRRKCQLLNLLGRRVAVDEIRGNVETRLAKLDSGDYDAIVLATAGLRRLGFEARIRPESIFDPLKFLPAVGQGALAIETRADDETTLAAVAPLDDAIAHLSVMAERAMLLELRGGCIAPIGAFTSVENGRLMLRGRILSLDGAECFDAADDAECFDAADDAECCADLNGAFLSEALGRSVAQKLLAQGAQKIIDELESLRKAP